MGVVKMTLILVILLSFSVVTQGILISHTRLKGTHYAASDQEEDNSYPEGSRLPSVYQQRTQSLRQLFSRLLKDLMKSATIPDSTLRITKPNCIRIPLYLGNGFSAHQVCVPMRTVLKKW